MNQSNQNTLTGIENTCSCENGYFEKVFQGGKTQFDWDGPTLAHNLALSILPPFPLSPHSPPPFSCAFACVSQWQSGLTLGHDTS